MADAPLPPHERTWRHPSELGPSPDLVEPSSRRSRTIAFSSGAVTAVLFATMVIAVTPRRSSAPSAISATTIPAASVQLRAGEIGSPSSGIEDSPMSAMVRIERQSFARELGVALVGAPNSISTAPAGDPAELDLALRRPEPADRVIVLTSMYTYEIAWDQLGDLLVPDGSIVMTSAGELLATFVAGDLRLLVD